MKILKDMSWPHFIPTDNLHTARSNPTLKASSTVYLPPEGAHGSDPSFRRLPEGTHAYSEEPVRELSPRPEPDSGTLTPVRPPTVPNPEPEISIHTREPHPGTLISDFDSKGLTPSKSTEELSKLEIVFPACLRDGKENTGETFDAQLPPSPSIVAKELSESLKGLQLAVTAMGLRGSGTISPPSDGSINDLIQFMPDSPVSEQPFAPMQTDYKWKPSKKTPRIDVSESSMDEPLGAFLPLSDDSNAASTFPAIQTVTSNHPVMVVSNLPPLTFDGPASIATITKDFSHAPGDCPTISEADESQGDTGFLLKIEGLTKITPRPPVTNNRPPLSALENIPMEDSSSLKCELPSAPDIPAVPEIPGLAEAPDLPQMPVMPGLPIDATGLASIPATPAPNLNKKQKIKVRGQKAVRKGRRLVMRKSVLSILLGRQLAGPTVEVLKLISKGGSVAICTVTSAAPIPALISMPL
jgi:hypothetical protein